MKRLLSVLKWILLGWGTISLAVVIAIVVFAAVQMGLASRSTENMATASDVRFVLNWCRLGDDRIDKVVHSYRSSVSFTGDHLDAYAIKISHVSLDELNKKPDNDLDNHWYRGDQLPPILDKAVAFAGAFQGDEIPWFPKEGELRSNQFYVYLWSIYFHGLEPSSVEIIFIRPSDNMVFFLDAKT
jgi:hypothetical protein